MLILHDTAVWIVKLDVLRCAGVEETAVELRDSRVTLDSNRRLRRERGEEGARAVRQNRWLCGCAGKLAL